MAMEVVAEIHEFDDVAIGEEHTAHPLEEFDCAATLYRYPLTAHSRSALVQPVHTRLKAIVPMITAITASSTRQAAGRAKTGLR